MYKHFIDWVLKERVYSYSVKDSILVRKDRRAMTSGTRTEISSMQSSHHLHLLCAPLRLRRNRQPENFVFVEIKSEILFHRKISNIWRLPRYFQFKKIEMNDRIAMLLILLINLSNSNSICFVSRQRREGVANENEFRINLSEYQVTLSHATPHCAKMKMLMIASVQLSHQLHGNSLNWWRNFITTTPETRSQVGPNDD